MRYLKCGSQRAPRVQRRRPASPPELNITQRSSLGANAECGVRNAECGVRSAECGVRSAESGVRSAEGGVRGAECGVRNAYGVGATRQRGLPTLRFRRIRLDGDTQSLRPSRETN